MILNDEELKEIEEFAGFLMGPEEIATILEVDPVELKKIIALKEGPVYRAFIKGKLKTEAALRKTTITLARQGSSPALTAALKLRDEMNAKLIER